MAKHLASCEYVKLFNLRSLIIPTYSASPKTFRFWFINLKLCFNSTSAWKVHIFFEHALISTKNVISQKKQSTLCFQLHSHVLWQYWVAPAGKQSCHLTEHLPGRGWAVCALSVCALWQLYSSHREVFTSLTCMSPCTCLHALSLCWLGTLRHLPGRG